jgi:hypothetical protein
MESPGRTFGAPAGSHLAAFMQLWCYAAAKTAFLTAWGSAIERNNAFG